MSLKKPWIFTSAADGGEAFFYGCTGPHGSHSLDYNESTWRLFSSPWSNPAYKSRLLPPLKTTLKRRWSRTRALLPVASSPHRRTFGIIPIRHTVYMSMVQAHGIGAVGEGRIDLVTGHRWELQHPWSGSTNWCPHSKHEMRRCVALVCKSLYLIYVTAC